ncbi:MAG: hypothetical protein US42_C0018G0018 [Candidatus Magasanikbacteria bacterium GW2011_GWC2_37_14]|uniref:Uncharacterized protein n=1 Tax=Candidatus Magasanikbacteria bacterium GW2011_GWC2_37_14 TaxID=1619046 RepID=A0A0G0IRZ5_9BACT|nr:MAG: hypothetical protein US42_C0018G0018 [Candidatus Magasanikbacteria bacterium GW2011_GWC2_37_14]
MTKKNKKTIIFEIVPKIHRVNLDLMKKTVYSQKFQSDIKKIRNIFNINKDGFQSGQECDLWHKKMVLQTDIDMENKNYLKALKNIEIKLKKGLYKKFSDYRLEKTQVNNSYIRLNHFDQELNDTVKNNKLPIHFKENVRKYIFFNDITAPSANHSIAFDCDKEYISVAVYNKPTRDEWKMIKEEVEMHLKFIKNKKFKFLSHCHYPLGDVEMHPMNKFNENVKLMKLSKKKNMVINDEEGDYKWKDQDVATEFLPEDATKSDVDKFIPNMRKIRSRMNKLSKTS